MANKVFVFNVEDVENEGYMIYSYNNKKLTPIFEELHLDFLSNLMNLHNLTSNLVYNDVKKIFTYEPKMDLSIKKEESVYSIPHKKLNEKEKAYIKSFDIEPIELNEKQISKLERKIKKTHFP